MEEWPILKKIFYKPEKGELILNKQRLVFMSARMLPSIHLAILKTIGEIANVEIYKSCEKSANNYYKNWKKFLPKDLTKEEVIKEFLKYLEYWGFGSVDIISLEVEKEIKSLIRIYGCSFSQYYEKPNKPVCYITAGIIAGLFSAILNKKVSVKERKCKAVGDNFCEFEVSLV
ncbi:MAG: V4R domain-containing protein [Candidatus Aenigmatarchaeota archaeon]